MDSIRNINTAINMAKIQRVLNHIKMYPSKEGNLAQDGYNKLIKYNLLIIFLFMLPFIIFSTCFMMFRLDNPKMPEGATRRIYGRIDLYDETFWYTDSSQKYEFNFDEYSIDKTYERGEQIYIYLNDNNEIVSVSHIKEDYFSFVLLILSIILPVIVLLVNYIIARKTYAKWWYSYLEWYNHEIDSCKYSPDFESIKATKKYYNVIIPFNELTLEEQKHYKKYRNRYIIYSLLSVILFILIMYIIFKLELNVNAVIFTLGLFIYVIIFYILLDNCSVEIHRIRTGFYRIIK